LGIASIAVPDEELRPALFSVGIRKLVVMSVATFSLYGLFWFYEHWWALKARDQARVPAVGPYRDIRPFGRTIFAFFFTHSLLQEFNESARRSGVDRSVAVGPTTAAFIILSLAGHFPDPMWLLSLFSVVPLAFAQRVANEVIARTRPEQDPNVRFVGWNWAALLIGLPLLLLIVVGSFLPE
jgi:hypothetical protein